MILVEDESGAVYPVDRERNYCACGVKTCGHLKRAHSFLSKSRTAIYEAYSGFHKELRLGNIDLANAWGSLLAEMFSVEAVLHYLEKACLEESTDIQLWIKLKQRKWRLDQAITAFCVTIKKWELCHYRLHHIVRWGKGLQKFQNDEIHSLPEAIDEMCKNRDFVTAYAIVFWIKSSKLNRKEFWDFFREWDQARRIRELEIAFSLKPKRSYEAMIFLETVLAGNAKGSSFRYYINKDRSKETILIPRSRSYYADNHVTGGYQITKAIWRDYAKDFRAASGRIDLRMSGLVSARLWRGAASITHRLCGGQRLTEIEWEDVFIPEDAWAYAISLDEYFYGFKH